ncbi:MAG: hypothetical protein IT329_03560 [Caldilineaceae bacterium]|nr:hypothetical protein [Caldilineaceae bacterium]
MHRKSTRILFGLVLLLLVLFGLGVAATVALGRTSRVGFGRMVALEPGAIDGIAQGIAHIDLPPGYAPEFGMRGLGFSMAAYTPGDDLSQLMLIQIPEWLPMDEAAIIRQARASAAQNRQGRGGPDGNSQSEVDLAVTVVEERKIDLGDHSVYYSIAEGTNEEGVAYRTLQVFFPGRHGKVVLLLEEPIARWDDGRAHALLASLR